MRRSVSFLALYLLISAVFASVSPAAETPFKYLSPVPGAEYVSPKSCLLFRESEALRGRAIDWKTSLRVEGSVSGLHEGKWKRSDDSRTLIFIPGEDFALGETVTVSLNMVRDGKSVYSHEFEIARDVITPDPEFFEDEEFGPAAAQGGREVSGHEMDARIKRRERAGAETFTLPPEFPEATVTVCDDPDSGKIFLANRLPRWQRHLPNYMMILGNDGFPEFFRKMEGTVYDFKKQPNGLLTYGIKRGDYFYVMDNTYTVVDSFGPQNNLSLDVHEFQMLPGGNVLLIANEVHRVDLSALGGSEDATVVTNVIQEIDQSKNLVFQWRTIDHMDIGDTNASLTGRRVDYAHVNAIEPDFDGNLLISSRHMSEVTKINRETGEVMWRLGGEKNDFTLIGGDTWFSRQHDIRRLDSGNVTVFDNGNLNSPAESRAIEYSLDLDNMEATRVWEYKLDPPEYFAFNGSAQRLPNGNTLIGWGSSFDEGIPEITEVREDGTKAFELFLEGNSFSYRAFRFPWEGKAARPYAWADTTSGGISLHFAKFGDDDVAEFIAYRGSSPEPMLRFARTDGFSVPVHDFTEGEPVYLRVRSVDRMGNMSPFSNELEIVPSFSDTLAMVSADVKIAPAALNVSSRGRWITALIGFPEGCAYTASDIERCSIMLNDTLLLEWSKLECEDGDTVLMAKFSREDVASLLPPEGTAAEIKISGYLPEAEFEGFDTIKVIRRGRFAEGEDGDKGVGKAASAEDGVFNYPNPFNPETVISFSLSAAGQVNLSVYDVQGKLVAKLADGKMEAGRHRVRWDGTNSLGEKVTSGIYFYRLSTEDETVTRKMILMR